MSNFKKKERQSEGFTVRCTPSMIAVLNAIAEREGVSRGEVVKEALEHRYSELKGINELSPNNSPTSYPT
jgi:predicted HicB family RNase H-like nuclease